MAIAATSCKSTKLISDKTTITKSDSTYYEKSKAIAFIPGSQLNLATNIGSRIVFVPVPGRPGETEPCIVIKNQLHSLADQEEIHTLKVSIDSLGNLKTTSDLRTRELEVEVLNQKRIIKEQSETIKVYEKKDSWFKGLMQKVAFGLIGFVVLIGIALFVLNKFTPGILK